jgi:hypothetical protein
VEGENKNVYKILSADSTLISVNDPEMCHGRKKRGREKSFKNI